MGKGRDLAYLDGKVEEGHVPLVPRHDVLVDDGHADGGETVGENRDGAVILDIGERLLEAAAAAAASRGTTKEGILLAAVGRTATRGRVGHTDGVVFVLFVRHGGRCRCRCRCRR